MGQHEVANRKLRTTIMKITICIISIVFLLSCNGQNRFNHGRNMVKTSASIAMSEVSVDSYELELEYQEEIKDTNRIESVIRFENFNLVIHDFIGYVIEMDVREGGEIRGKRTYWGHYGGGSHLNEAILNDCEYYDENNADTLIMLKDTLHLSESVFGNKNRYLFQIIPNNEIDNYSISYCYLMSLGETCDDRLLNDTEIDEFNQNRFYVKESSIYSSIKESLGFFFQLILVKDRSELAQNNTGGLWTQSFYDLNIDIIKITYSLSDTVVQLIHQSSRFKPDANLTKDDKLYILETNAYLFKIDRFNKNKLIDSKYIVINLAYGD